MNKLTHIKSEDIWVKVVEMLQQNWALIEKTEDDRTMVYFITDASTVFDEMEFSTIEKAKKGLHRNGFEIYADKTSLQRFISPPKPPYKEHWDKSRKIYSLGKFWK